MTFLACVLACVLQTGVARGQLQAWQVLVVYDSRSPDSLAVAEYYAGSAVVPGGVGGQPGARRGVRVVNLADTGAPAALVADITQAQFIASFRNPLRAWLAANDPRGRIRCLVMTKGLAHRILDTDNPNVGEDFSGAQPVVVTELLGGDSTYASVDSELTLLQQTLDTGEAGAGGDSKLDGMIINPFHNAYVSIGSFSTAARTQAKSFNAVPVLAAGTLWRGSSFTAGDIYLVCRLDGPTVQIVRDIIDRAAISTVGTTGSIFILDESRSDGVANNGPNGELDNQDFDNVNRPIWKGDDYEQARNFLNSDGRFDPAGVRYDAGPYPTNYFYGPRVSVGTIQLSIIADPILYLASEGGNSDGTPNGAPRGQLPDSFFWAPMAFYGTLESYNARDFNGKGTYFNQSQISSALIAGATFAAGNCWEPFSQTVLDNDLFIRRFYAGTWSFAEAAWASIPVLSWQQIVVGDPLARVRRSSENADQSNSGVNVDDMYEWERSPQDINRNNLANDADRRLLETSIRPATGVLDMVNQQR